MARGMSSSRAMCLVAPSCSQETCACSPTSAALRQTETEGQHDFLPLWSPA